MKAQTNRFHAGSLAMAALFAGALLWLVGPSAAQQHVYDAAGRLVWSSQPSGASTSIVYDPAGNVLAVAAVTPGTDSDGDGVPDRYEVEFTGSVVGIDGSADPDGRGVTNAVAYAFGAPPSGTTGASAGSFVTPLGVQVDGITGEAFLHVQFRRPKDGPVLWTYTPEVSTSLGDWSSDPSDVFEAEIIDEGGGFEIVILHARVQQTDLTAVARVRLTRVIP